MEIYDIKPIQTIIDFVNFFKFKRSLRKEMRNIESKFNEFGLKKNWLGNIVYTQIDCKDDELMSFDFNYERMLQKRLYPIIEYLSTELGWGDYLTMQVSNFVDDEGEPTLSYAVLFIFSGYNMNMTKMFIMYILTFLMSCSIIGLILWLIFR